jgi:hypothetical protein
VVLVKKMTIIWPLNHQKSDAYGAFFNKAINKRDWRENLPGTGHMGGLARCIAQHGSEK